MSEQMRAVSYDQIKTFLKQMQPTGHGGIHCVGEGCVVTLNRNGRWERLQCTQTGTSENGLTCRDLIHSGKIEKNCFTEQVHRGLCNQVRGNSNESCLAIRSGMIETVVRMICLN